VNTILPIGVTKDKNRERKPPPSGSSMNEEGSSVGSSETKGNVCVPCSKGSPSSVLYENLNSLKTHRYSKVFAN
jgi:hypothetical protein